MLMLEKIRRLREMSWAEMQFRATQSIRITRERWGLRRNGTGSHDGQWQAAWDPHRVLDPVLQRALRELSGDAGGLLSHYFEKQVVPRFYGSVSERAAIRRAYESFFPHRTEEICCEARAICEHRFRIFAYPEVACGARIPWRRDLVNGVESGLEHWSRVPYLEFEKVGDSKIVWEPNRHQHFVTLGQAYFLTGEERFAEECLSEWEDWRNENPYLCGINWASSLELAFRAWSWVWALHLLRGSRALTEERLGRMTAGLAQHAQFVAANLSTYFSPNTHLLGEGFVLFVLGLVLPELRGAEEWCETGRRILLQEIERQVRPDGSHREQSVHYHAYATDFFLCAAVLADRNGRPFAPAYYERLKRMVEYLLHTAWPSGDHPSVGDSDGGRLLPFSAREPNDFRAILSTAAVYLSRGDFKSRAGRFYEETFWLLGAGARERFEHLEPCPPEASSCVFPDAGTVVQRGDWADTSCFLLFDAGPQGMDRCGHGHADSLSIVCAADGAEWLVDPGTYGYTKSHEWRDFFRSTRAHNTLVVDSFDQAEAVDTFKWDKIPVVQLECSAMLRLLDLGTARHKGYLRLPSPVEPRRTVVFVKPDYWILTDEISGRGTHRLEFFFHFAPGVRLERVGELWCAGQGSRRFLLLPLGRDLEWQLVEGSEQPSQGWHSKDYGHREPAPVLVAAAHREVPASYQWILWPATSRPAPKVEEFGTGPCGLRINTVEWMDDVVTRGSATKQSETDAEFAYCRRSRSHELMRVVMLQGTKLTVEGRLVIDTAHRVEELEIAIDGQQVEIHARPEVDLRLFAPDAGNLQVNGRAKPFQHRGDWIEVLGEN